MMRLILHIGLTKTGTSAIQTYCWNNREVLLSRYKILYPVTGLFFGAGPAHYKFTWFYFKDLEKRIKDSEILNELRGNYKSIKQLFEELMQELNNINISDFPNSMIFSCENYSVINPELLVSDIYEFSDKIRLSEIIVIIYLRRQDKWLEAAYSQHVKGGYYTDFKSFTANSLKRNDLYYWDILNRWRKAFPEAKIVPRIYDRKLFPNGNVIIDFMSVLGIKIQQTVNYNIEANPSLSFASILALRKINEKFNLSITDRKRVVKYLMKLDKEERTPIKTLLTLPERIEFLEQFRDINERLFREWFDTENKFVLSEEEIEFYKIQDSISIEEIEKIIEHRYARILDFIGV